MKHTKLNAIELMSAGYDVSTKTMEIRDLFIGVYQYYGVDEYVYKGLLTAEDKDEYFRSKIFRKYESKLVKENASLILFRKLCKSKVR